MHFLNILPALVAGMATVFLTTSATPVATAVEARSAIFGPPPPVPEQLCCKYGCGLCGSRRCGPHKPCGALFNPQCCALQILGKRSEDGAMMAFNQKGELVQFVDFDEKDEVERGEVEQGLVEPVAARDLDIVGPPPFAEQFCCNYGCTKCIQHQCPTGKQCGIFWHPNCCALEILGKRSEDGAIVAYNQKGQLVQFVDVVEPEPVSVRDVDVAEPTISARDVEIVGPPPPPEHLCCDPECRYCSGQSCNVQRCFGIYKTCCTITASRKRNEDGTKEAYNQKGELVQFVSATSE